MWKEYEKHSTVPSFVDISNAIKGGKTEFVMHFINSIPEINLENRLSDDAKKLKGWVFSFSSNVLTFLSDIFTLVSNIRETTCLHYCICVVAGTCENANSPLKRGTC